MNDKRDMNGKLLNDEARLTKIGKFLFVIRTKEIENF